MQHSSRTSEKVGGTSLRGPNVFRGARNPMGEEAPAFIKLGCSQCSTRFVLDGEEWDRLPREMEVTGRDFLGISKDAVLCPTCLHEVERAGAQQIYWQVVA